MKKILSISFFLLAFLTILSLLYNSIFVINDTRAAADQRDGICICRRTGQPDETAATIIGGGIEACQFEADDGIVPPEDCPGGSLVFRSTGEGGIETITPLTPLELDALKLKKVKVDDLIGLFKLAIPKFLGLTGSIALVFFIYGGIMWLTSGGSPDKIKKARDIMIWAGLGLLVIFGSYLIVGKLIEALSPAIK